MKYLLKRTAAYLIDCTLCFSVIMLVVQWGVLSHTRHVIGITDAWFQNSRNMSLYVLLSISIPVWGYFTYFDSCKSRDSLGKRLLNLSVVDLQGNRLKLRKSFIRTLLKLLPWELAHLGVIFPTPLYFEAEPNLRILTAMGMLLFIVYIASILLKRNRNSMYDQLMGWQVIEG